MRTRLLLAVVLCLGLLAPASPPARTPATLADGPSPQAAGGSGVWRDVAAGEHPSARANYAAVWTGNEMIVWGGEVDHGERYNPATGTWADISSVDAPSPLYSGEYAAVWTGEEMIIWAGPPDPVSAPCLESSRRYNPAKDAWVAISSANAPSAKDGHTAIWTGKEMIIWGGRGRGYLDEGKRYDPVTDTWGDVSSVNAPSAREDHSGVWTGEEMIIWGGSIFKLPPWPFQYTPLNDGKRYDPAADAWKDISAINAPSARRWHTAIWTGSEMIVWGGWDTSGNLGDGKRYSPATEVLNMALPSQLLVETSLVPPGCRQITVGGTPVGEISQTVGLVLREFAA